MKRMIWLGILAILLAACGAKTTEQTSSESGGMGMGMGNPGMMERHHARIPDEYNTLKNPVAADAESLERGAEVYTTNCASCHGDGGMGDGPAAEALDPAPSAIAHTSQMMGDGYLFWRISEGGAQFVSTMPAWKDTLDEQARWDVINYVRALGEGQVTPASGSGGEVFDPQVQATQQAEMLSQAVEQGVITQAEAEVFNTVHSAVEQYREDHPEVMDLASDATERDALMLAELVKSGTITQEQADAFKDVHDRLGEAGLMP